jgi:hypothetical protein
MALPVVALAYPCLLFKVTSLMFLLSPFEICASTLQMLSGGALRPRELLLSLCRIIPFILTGTWWAVGSAEGFLMGLIAKARCRHALLFLSAGTATILLTDAINLLIENLILSLLGSGIIAGEQRLKTPLPQFIL